MMIASLVLTVVVGVLSRINDDFAVLILLPVLCFVVGFLRVLYGVFLAEKREARANGAASRRHVVPIMPEQPGAAARIPELSTPRAARPSRASQHRVETAEMVEPPSVTENTTRFLDEESGPRRVSGQHNCAIIESYHRRG
jgi:hypothetical protein